MRRPVFLSEDQIACGVNSWKAEQPSLHFRSNKVTLFLAAHSFEKDENESYKTSLTREGRRRKQPLPVLNRLVYTFLSGNSF
jgi:hypothetical protein